MIEKPQYNFVNRVEDTYPFDQITLDNTIRFINPLLPSEEFPHMMNTLQISLAALALVSALAVLNPARYFFNGNSVISPNTLARASSPSVNPASISPLDSGDVSMKDDRIARISSTIRIIPDFPKPGIMFQDITTMLLDPVAFKDTIDLFVERYKNKDISVVAGIVTIRGVHQTAQTAKPPAPHRTTPYNAIWNICGVEARGFIFGPPIALRIGAKFVPMRKPNRLPGAVISEEYSLEYGTDIMEMHVGAVQAGERTLVVDDLIATGGTLVAAINLLERVGAEIVECACVIELPDLKGRDRLGDKPLFVLISSN
ncbi:hypothetical protein LXL04_031757 [Taraxacum kok-saghyz]